MMLSLVPETGLALLLPDKAACVPGVLVAFDVLQLSHPGAHPI